MVVNALALSPPRETIPHSSHFVYKLFVMTNSKKILTGGLHTGYGGLSLDFVIKEEVLHPQKLLM